MTPQASATSFWTVLRLLLAAAYRRAIGRRRRQRELFRQRAAKKTNFGQLGFLLGAVLLAMVHVAAAFMVSGAVSAGERIRAERQGWVVADQWFVEAVANPGRLRRLGVPFDAARAMDHAEQSSS